MSSDNLAVVYDDVDPQIDLVMEVEVINDTDEEVSNRDPEDEALSGSVVTEDESTRTSPIDDEHIFTACTQKRSVNEEESQESKKRKSSDECEDDGRLCTICLDNWTNTGEHRICALKCGHLFGHNCIMRWISSNKSCPSCKEKASKKDVRFIYANKLITVDTTELEILKKQLDLAIEDKNRIQIELTRSICKEQLLIQEIEGYKQKIKVLSTLNDCSKSQSFGGNKTQKDIPLMRHTESFQICQQGSCRVMDIHPRTGKFVISLKSPNTVFQGFGIRKYNIENLASIAYTPLHSKPIRDLKFNHTNTSLLSVSLDKVAKVIDINSNGPICSYTGDNMLWSCCWDANHQNIFYVGEQQGSISKFDLRNMNGAVGTYKINNDMSPVVSLVSIPSYPGSVMPLGGFIACKLNSTWAFEDTGNGEYSRNIIPIEGPFISMSYNSEFNQLLVSARPNAREPNTRHIVCTLEKYNDSMLKCNSVHTFCGGRLQKQLSRSCFIQNIKDQNSYIAAQKDNSVVVWSVNNGNTCSVLRTYCPVIDLMSLNNTSGSHLLALSEKKLDLYKFSDFV